MENKNVLMAVVLSTMVIIFWQFMYGDEYIELENKQIKTEQLTKSEKPSAPSIVKKKAEIKVSRSDAITETGRIKIENKAKIKVFVYAEETMYLGSYTPVEFNFFFTLR